MNKADRPVFDRVCEVLTVELGLEDISILPESDLSIDLGITEVELLSIIFELEREFELPHQNQFSNRKRGEATGSIVTVTDLCKYIQQRLSPVIEPAAQAAPADTIS